RLSSANGTAGVDDGVGIGCEWNWDPLWHAEDPSTSVSNGSDLGGDAQWSVSRADEQDSINVDDLSELLTHIEAQEEDGGVDFSVFIEDEDALNVEEISDVFSALEEVAGLLPLGHYSVNEGGGDGGLLAALQDNQDAQNVDAVSELFGILEQEAAEEASSLGASEEDVCDAANVDEVSELFSSLEECGVLELDHKAADEDDAANVDSVADLFAELAEMSELSVESDNGAELELQKRRKQKQRTQEQDQRRCAAKSVFLCGPVAAAKVDARIFVPQICVRIEGRDAVSTVGRGVCSGRAAPVGAPTFLAGPPQLLSSSALSREDRVDRWREKRKVRSFVVREPDACVSDTRRACAAKRQRVKGRFTSEKSAFVSITALQDS
ncbi:hypothetical protein PybrP1_007700, partial [[Pythium] brassicae (nom. inval.)]